MISASSCLVKIGDPVEENDMVLWDVPTQLEIGVIPKRIYCNKRMVKPLESALKRLIQTGCVAELKTWDGCVSGDTEYFTGEGWSRIDNYTNGMVGQVDDLGNLTLVTPDAYTIAPCDRFIILQSSQGVYQKVSGGHRVIYYNNSGNEVICTADELLEKYKLTPHTHISIPSTFNFAGPGISYSDDYIRLKVAVFADGCFPHKNRGSAYCRILLRKERKIKRLRDLLSRLNLEYKESINNREETSFYFVMDNDSKHFYDEWYSCSKHQLEIICDEVNHWDSSIDNQRFFSTFDIDVDFIQFARSACGMRSKIVTTRIGKGLHKTCYAATLSNNQNPCVSVKGGIYEVNEPDSKKYCFTVPTGRLLLRYKGHIFVTGNCFNIRSKRRGTSYSLHSWGLAVDLNAAWNQMGKPSSFTTEFVECFTQNGFDWGGDWAVPDAMHFQLKEELL